MSDFGKNRVLTLYKILTAYTDELHQISMQDILVHMEAEGLSLIHIYNMRCQVYIPKELEEVLLNDAKKAGVNVSEIIIRILKKMCIRDRLEVIGESII